MVLLEKALKYAHYSLGVRGPREKLKNSHVPTQSQKDHLTWVRSAASQFNRRPFTTRPLRVERFSPLYMRRALRSLGLNGVDDGLAVLAACTRAAQPETCAAAVDVPVAMAIPPGLSTLSIIAVEIVRQPGAAICTLVCP